MNQWVILGINLDMIIVYVTMRHTIIHWRIQVSDGVRP